MALVGASGCGKSTIPKLVSGLYQPWSGEVLFDGKPRSAYPRDVITGSLSVVDQDITLFEDSIAENIVITAPQLTQEDAWEAAEAAGLAEDIRAMPMGMHTVISEGQGGVSGGSIRDDNVIETADKYGIAMCFTGMRLFHH